MARMRHIKIWHDFTLNVIMTDKLFESHQWNVSRRGVVIAGGARSASKSLDSMFRYCKKHAKQHEKWLLIRSINAIEKERLIKKERS